MASKTASRWSQPNFPGSFSSAAKLRRGLKKKDDADGKTASQTRRELSQHVLFQAHRDLRQVFPRRHVAVTNFSDKWEIDLGELPGRLKSRKYDKLFLVAVDAFSRKILARGLPNRTGPTVVKALDHVIKRLKAPHTRPRLIESDRGKEFDNVHFAKYCRDHQIRHKFAYGTHKARMAERGVRSLKRVIMAAKQSGRYPDLKWPELVERFADTLGQRHNRSIGTSPDEAPKHYRRLSQAAWDAKQLVGADTFFRDAERIQPGGEGLEVGGRRFRLGDSVLAAIPKQRKGSVKDKEYLMHYDLMPRLIDRIYHFQRPPLFQLRVAKSGQKIPRLFYAQEMRKVELPAPARSIVAYRITRARGLEYQTEDKRWLAAS